MAGRAASILGHGTQQVHRHLRSLRQGRTGPGGRRAAAAAARPPVGAAAAGKAPKLGKDGQPKVSRLTKLGQVGMISQAYKMTYKNDPKLPWVMLIAFVVVVAWSS